LYLRK